MSGNGGAVDGDEIAVRARAQRVHGAREQFLAGAALAQQQHRGVDVGATFSIMRQTFCIGSLDGDDAVERHDVLVSARAPVLLLELVDMEGALHDQLQHVRVDGLLVEIVSAETDGLDGVLACRAGRSPR